MIKITKENIILYLKEHLPDFDDSLPVNISADTEGISGIEAGNGYQQSKPAGDRNVP